MTKRKPLADQMTSTKAPKSDALAATEAMAKLLPADDGDPAHQPVKDWSVVNPNWCSVDDVLDYIAEHGRRDIPKPLIDAVMKRHYGIGDKIEAGPRTLADMLLSAQTYADSAKNLNYALNMLSTTLSNDVEVDAVGELCDQIEHNIGSLIGLLAEMDRRALATA